MTRSKKLFISHSSKDKGFAEKLTRDLYYYGIEAWLDEAELSLGDQLTKSIIDAIERFDYLAIVISSYSVRSDWVKKELKIAKEKGKKIIPILLEKVEIPSDVKDDIGDRVYADFTSPDIYAPIFQKFLQLLGFTIPVKDKLSIFLDSLMLGWENASWGCDFYDDKSTHYVHSGKNSICARLRGFGGLAFAFRSGINTTGYKKLEFYINGGEVGGQKLKVYVNDRPGNGVRNPVSLNPLISKEWELITIPLKDLDAAGITIVKINISDVSGSNTPDFYLDDLCLVA